MPPASGMEKALPSDPPRRGYLGYGPIGCADAQSFDPAPKIHRPRAQRLPDTSRAAHRAFVGAVPAAPVRNPDALRLAGTESPFLFTAQAARGRAAAPSHATERPPPSRTKICICPRPRVVHMQAVTSTPPSDVTASPPPRGGAAHLAARPCGERRGTDSGHRHIPSSMQIRPPQGILPATNTRTPAGRLHPCPSLRRRIRAAPRYAITAPCQGRGTERRTGA